MLFFLLLLVGGRIGVEHFLADGGRICAAVLTVLAVAELAWVEVVLADALLGAFGSVAGDNSAVATDLVLVADVGILMRAPMPEGGGGTGVSTFGLLAFGRIGAAVWFVADDLSGIGVEGVKVALDGSAASSPLETSVSAVESRFRLRGAAALADGFVAAATAVSGVLLSPGLLESSEGNRPRI